MMIELKILQLKKVFNVSPVACNQVVHPNHVITFTNKLVAEVEPRNPAAPVMSIRSSL